MPSVKPFTLECYHCQEKIQANGTSRDDIVSVYQQMDVHARLRSHHENMMGTQLVWDCGYVDCTNQEILGTTPDRGMHAYKMHVYYVHDNKFKIPLMKVRTLPGELRPVTRTRSSHVVKHQAATQAPHLPSHPHVHSHPPLHPHVQPLEFSQNPSNFWRLSEPNGEFDCQIRGCIARYNTQELAATCLQWHLRTGCYLTEYPSDHGGSLKLPSLNPNKPLYNEIKESDQSGDSYCEYPDCGRRYATDQIAFMCRRWHRNTGRLVHEIPGHQHHQAGRTHTNAS